ncbi:hypothetical protein [Ciceribacter sp. L1K22]|uniref:hypothetical protein n=1 Tax=Ciceribacter sp. L1K22 TaxID=2820275 RepID=UPI001ABE8298|nr:hypothetical protein [Ciceribacter sp. L1K22]MBO3760128.1 hypothetical protein [Ciceribacter sp. L1K22]
MGIAKQAAMLRAARNSASIRSYHPVGTVKCEGVRLFRSQVARDVGCILDLNPSVTAWRCMPSPFDAGGIVHVPDFEVFDEEGSILYLDAPDRSLSAAAAVIASEAARVKARYRLLDRAEIYDGFRLRNARDLLRYASHETPLGDRLRLLTALDEHGSLPLSDCLRAFLETKPVAGIASLILHGFIEVDLDEAPLSPETAVRRIAR